MAAIFEISRIHKLPSSIWRRRLLNDQIRRRFSKLSTVYHPSSSYHDVPSYLAYAKSQNLSIESTVFRGKYYEFQTKQVLEEFFNCKEHDLMVTGGSYDQGVDILGKWNLKQYLPAHLLNMNRDSAGSTPSKLKLPSRNGKSLLSKVLQKDAFCVDLLIQCKTSNKKIPAKLIRELSGMYNQRVKTPRQRQSTFMVLVSNNTMTDDSLNQFTELSIPMIFLQVELPRLKEGRKGAYDQRNYEKGLLLSYFRNPKAKLLLGGLNDYEDINYKIVSQVRE
ncbi:Rrg7 protein [Saccharomycopsis crataegensis]|uniref:Required for respiratory growth protein 7, mitochondrial n=1 Tax=Saccharomycopsis crataegensis TaxID=43959 RepID=A0AAV5QS42_9ASCO|nr:Rrg7 protein [Saccharomycopsis crataegensis]